MDYLKLIRSFWKRHDEEPFTGNETLLYWRLVDLFNAAGTKDVWPDTLRFSDGQICVATGISPNTLDKFRKALQTRQLIGFQTTGKGYRAGAEYRLVNTYSSSKRTSESSSRSSSESNSKFEELPERTSDFEELNNEVPQKDTQEVPQQVPQILSKSYIYIVSKPQTPNQQTFKHILFVAYRSDVCVLKSWFWLLKNKKKENPQKRTDPFLRKRNSELCNVPFSQWWALYQKGIKEDHCRVLWIQLTDSDRLKALDHTPRYVAATPQKQYRKNPENYLDEKVFNDEIIPRHGNQNQRSPAAGPTPPQTGKEFGGWAGNRFGKRSPDESSAA
jgi:hypothetical protein